MSLNSPFTHFCLFGGIATGKSYTGAHFAIANIVARPDVTGFIGANSYDQLSQATLREFFYWLEEYGFEYVVDRYPPESWKVRRQFKSYKNVISVRANGWVTHIITRVLSNPDPLRGIELSWYWLDESRDTDEYAHDMILGRMRESDLIRGLITTTTNGDDWVYKRFTQNANGTLYGSMHVPTNASLNLGIITKIYYNQLERSYSALMAEQELHARHVNVFGGRAYYSASERNKSRAAPWGDSYPSRDRPLVIGCDFNFSPAPMCWMIGQIGPHMYGPKGEYFGECIHWFRELSEVGISTPQMTMRLISQYPDFFYEVFGDMSGNIGTTSNAGKTDYDQIGETLSDSDCQYTISVEQMSDDEAHVNPRVRSRVENMNALFKNAVGEVRQTYDPTGCPLFDGDVRGVGWKPTTQSGRGKLDDGGDKQRTHSSDAAGYAVYKKFPPVQRGRLVESIPSAVRG